MTSLRWHASYDITFDITFNDLASNNVVAREIAWQFDRAQPVCKIEVQVFLMRRHSGCR